ncbi:sulfatase [Arthrobacter sp. NtRootA1]|uniref:sulfatase family protein n=1 Tax=Arthrobacter sp. NtRootA1 TaxID=2830983 RepID=UPI001CC5B233|nr:sulfatase [Arthrobacter sp. NtRootA1]BCW05921.1 putative sulfatase [Arthrobacter sp. NtRootA1]
MTTEAPDIVLIHCHDLGRWLSIYGMPDVPSPNLEAFAKGSVVFENAHSTAPLCSPARGSLFTGLSPHRHGVQGLAHNSWRYRGNVLTAPEHLAKCGYKSTLIGLQHENADARLIGFDDVIGLGYLPRANTVVESAAAWLQRLPAKGERAPIFLTVGIWEVHRPWPAEDYAAADPSQVNVPAYLPDNESTRADIAAFHGSIRQLDAAMGRIFKAINEELNPRTTMIVFTTDHGAPFPRAKSSLYDAGTGVTLIVRPPTAWDVRPGVRREIVSHLDILPTFLDAAGASADENLEGISLRSPMQEPLDTGSERVVFTSKSHHDHYDPIRAVRSENYAYIRNFEPNPLLKLSGDLEGSPTRHGMGDSHLAPRPREELYDREIDPDELTNLVDDPTYAGIRSRYSALLAEWMDDTRDPLLDGPITTPPPRTRTTDGLPELAAPKRLPVPSHLEPTKT